MLMIDFIDTESDGAVGFENYVPSYLNTTLRLSTISTCQNLGYKNVTVFSEYKATSACTFSFMF